MTDDVIDSRRVALDLLGQVCNGSPLDDVFERSHADKPLQALAPRDRALVRRLVTITLRHFGEIDAVIDKCLNRPLPARADRRRNLLRLGVAQLLFGGTPAHAAVDTMVRLEHHARMRGFINAVLRRVGREQATLTAGLDAPRLNTPDWLWDSWCNAYGRTATQAIAAAHLHEPPLDFTLKDRSPASLKHWTERLEAKPLPWGTLRCANRGAIDELPGYDEGAWWIQDGAAALPAQLLGDIEGRIVFDLCAAPGGKTAQLAARGARVTAVDRSPTRLVRLEANLKRLALNATIVCADATEWRPAGTGDSQAEAILLDAPCTSTGTLRRRPDVALHKSSANAAELTHLQDELIDRAIDLLRPGGTLVYSVCSLQPEEGEQRIAAALARHPGLRREPVTAAEIAGQSDFVTASGDLQTLPSQLPEIGGLDGFFAARLVRVS